MSAPRIAAYPIEHVTSELVAFPLVSETAFRLSLVSLDALVRNETRVLWRQAAQELLREFPSTSVDEINNLRDSIWFRRQEESSGREGGNPPSPWESLADYLHRIAKRRLEVRGASAVPVLRKHREGIAPAKDGEARWSWRWLSFALPPDLLLGALDHPVGTIGGVCQDLARIIEDAGYAQSHMHLGAALSFSDYWVGTLHRLASTAFQFSDFRSPGAVFNEGRDLGHWLLRAALVRQCLGNYLCEGGGKPFLQFLHEDLLPPMGWHAGALQDACQSLAEGVLVGVSEDQRSLYASWTGLTTTPPPASALDIQAHDPLALSGWFQPDSSGHLTPEIEFVSAGLRYLRQENGRRDEAFAVLFWQVVRIRGLLYRHLIQRPMTPGLQWFMLFYSRMRAGKDPRCSFRLRLEQALLLEGYHQGLRSLEFRIGPGSVDEMRRAIRACEDLRREHLKAREQNLLDPTSPSRLSKSGRLNSGAELELGMVVHFTKERGGATAQGAFEAYWKESHAHPFPCCSPDQEERPRNMGFRYQLYYRDRKSHAEALGRLLLEQPLSLTILRGLDVCTDELGVPTWVMVPLFRFVREASHVASRWIAQTMGWEVPVLQTTAHAGEDFVHLLGGLRRIDEAITYLPLLEGDRIGHGLALGIEPHDWVHRTGVVVLAKEERLFDLAWEWEVYRSDALAQPSRQRLLFIEAEIQRLMADLFGEAFPNFAGHPRMVRALVDAIHSETFLKRIEFPNVPRPLPGGSVTPEHLAFVHLTDPGVFERGRQLISVNLQHEGQALLEVQKSLRRKVGRMGLTVEVNPSSNLLIGDLTDLKNHPLWRLNPPEPLDDVPPVAICIGSDDPLTFATSLPQELQLMVDALVRAGLSQDQAYRWLHSAREQGMNARFTLPITAPIPIEEHRGPVGVRLDPLP